MGTSCGWCRRGEWARRGGATRKGRGREGRSTAAQQVLAIVAYRQPVSQAGIEGIRGTGSDSAIGTLLQRRLVAVDQHRLFTTTPAFLEYLGLRDLGDLPPLSTLVDGE